MSYLSSPNSQIENRQRHRKKKKQQRTNRLVFLLICLCIIIAMVNSGFSYLIGIIADVVKVDNVTWEQTVSGQIWMFQKEVVVSSNQRGRLEPIIVNGERTSKGNLVARIHYLDGTSLEKEGTLNLYSPIAGIVLYSFDGLEALDTLENFSDLTILKIEKALIDYNSQKASKEQVQESNLISKEDFLSGSVVFKVSDNLETCYIYFKSDQPMDSWFKKDQALSLRAPDGTEGKAIMQEYKKVEDAYAILMKLSSGLEKQRLQREGIIDIITKKQEVVAVPKAAVYTKNEEKGVFIYEKGYVNWQPINIIEETAEQTLIEGIESECWVVLRPWFVRDGMPLKFNSKILN